MDRMEEGCRQRIVLEMVPEVENRWRQTQEEMHGWSETRLNSTGCTEELERDCKGQEELRGFGHRAVP